MVKFAGKTGIVKKILAVLISSVLVLCGFTASAVEAPFTLTSNTVTLAPRATLDPASVEAKNAILMEAKTGKVLFEKAPDERVAPASITKIMSLLLIMEAIERGDLALTDQVTCSDYAASMGGSQIWLEPGEIMSVNDLLKAVAVGSANDATVALAEKVAGSEAAFVDMMNRRAEELGLTNTHFTNSNGLDSEDHFTSARDTAIIASELLKHKLIIQYSTIWMDSLRNGKTELVNTNRLVRFYNGITGLKTGTTSKAGSCLAATAERNGLALIAVVMGAETSDKRFASARTLLDYGYANYTMHTPNAPDMPLEVAVKGGTEEKVQAIPEGITSIVIPKGYEKSITYTTDLTPTCEAPVEKGQILGRVIIKANDQEIGGYNLIAQTAVEKMTFFKALQRLFFGFISL